MINGASTVAVLPSEFPMPGPALDIGAPWIGAQVPGAAPLSMPLQDGSGVLGPVLLPPGSTILGGYRPRAEGLGEPGRDASVEANVAEGQPVEEPASWGPALAAVGVLALVL